MPQEGPLRYVLNYQLQVASLPNPSPPLLNPARDPGSQAPFFPIFYNPPLDTAPLLAAAGHLLTAQRTHVHPLLR